MKATNYILLGIGSAGLLAGFFEIVSDGAFMNPLMTMICGASLVNGYFTIHKTKKSNC